MNDKLTEFNTGGSHEQNPLGGIPIGTNPISGAPVTVEEGETKTKIGGQDFIFSNNFKVTKQIIKDYKLPDYLDGLSMSDASKKISERFSDRHDGIVQNTMSQFFARLSSAQEVLKAEKLQALQEAIALNNQYPDETLEGQAPAGVDEYMQPEVEQPLMNDGLGGMGVPQQQMAMGGTTGFLGGVKGNPNGTNATTMSQNTAGATTGIMGLVDQAGGNTSPDTGKAVLGGAASGAAVGTMIFPGIGTAIGAGVGAVAGAVGANQKRKKLENETNDAAMNYNRQFQEQFALGGFPVLGDNILRNNAYGGMKPQPKQPNNRYLETLYNTGQDIMTPDYINKVAPHYANQNPILNAQEYLIGQGMNLKGGADGKWGNSSQENLNAWRAKNGINNTGPLTADDYERMGYTNMGYKPYEEVLPEVVISKEQPATTTTPVATAGVTPTTTQTTNKHGLNPNQMMRMMTPLGNILQLGSLSKPNMGNPYIDLTKADRNYIDEAAMIRAVENQGNTLNRSIQQSGMSEGARRASMIAAGLQNQNAVGNAFIQAQQANRSIDANADQLDTQTRAANIQRRIMVDDNYQRDLGAYNTERSKLRAQIGTDIGNIGLENLRSERIGKATGYSVDGNYLVDNNTGERYDSTKLASKIEELRAQEGSAKTDFDKQYYEKERIKLERLQAEVIAANAPRETTNESKKSNKQSKKK